MYDIILFDLDDTLLNFSASEHLSLKNIHQQFYRDINLNRFERSYKEINAALWARVGVLTNPLNPVDIQLMRFEQLNAKLECTVSASDVALNYEEGLGAYAEWYPGVQSVIHFLRQQGHILGIVTNGLTNVQIRKYERHNLGTWFDCYIVSDAVGFAKPQKGIFDCALKAISLKRNQSLEPSSSSMLMVGDNVSSDGYGAKQYGMDFCFINHNKIINQDPELPIKYDIHSVTELARVLGYSTEYDHFLNGVKPPQLSIGQSHYEYVVAGD